LGTASLLQASTRCWDDVRLPTCPHLKHPLFRGVEIFYNRRRIGCRKPEKGKVKGGGIGEFFFVFTPRDIPARP
jgi:hypothetical protein